MADLKTLPNVCDMNRNQIKSIQIGHETVYEVSLCKHEKMTPIVDVVEFSRFL